MSCFSQTVVIGLQAPVFRPFQSKKLKNAMNNRTIIEFGFRKISRISKTSVSVIVLSHPLRQITLTSVYGLNNSGYPVQSTGSISSYHLI